MRYLIAFAVLVSTAFAQERPPVPKEDLGPSAIVMGNCYKYETVRLALYSLWGEVSWDRALMPNGNAMETFLNPMRHTMTVVEVSPNNVACYRSAGMWGLPPNNFRPT